MSGLFLLVEFKQISDDRTLHESKFLKKRNTGHQPQHFCLDSPLNI